MTTEDRWAELAIPTSGPAGTTRLRVAPETPHDLFIGLIQPGARPCFWFDVPAAGVPDDYRLPALRSVGTTIRPAVDAPDVTRIELVLENDDLGEVFRAMVNDLVTAVSLTADTESGLVALDQRMERWRRLLRSDSTGGLTLPERRGLFGELAVLRQLLDAASDSRRIVSAWTGPAGRHQDFQARHGAIEVKSTVTKQPQSLIIASERELDRTGVPRLFLMHLSLDERQGGAGQSLNGIVGELRQRLAVDPAAAAAFDGSLIQAGYLSDHAPIYEGLCYSTRDQSAYEVVDGFPCVTERDVPVGVGDVTYRIQLGALQPFAVPLVAATDSISTR